MIPFENFFSPLSFAVNATVLHGAGIVSPIFSVLNITDPRYAGTVLLSLSTARSVISIASPTRAVVGATISICVAVLLAEKAIGAILVYIKKTAVRSERNFFMVKWSEKIELVRIFEYGIGVRGKD